MALELCYTSAPKGLLPATHGFCTVAASAELSRPMAEQLESLSGYRPMFGVGDERANQNPVAWSHLRMSLGGATRSVLSRVAYAGADYSGRSNKFAHHVLLNNNECAAAGPAWLLAQQNVMRHAWDQEPQTLTTPPKLPTADADAAVCEHWRDAAGDAGWAGVLAEWQLLNPAMPAYLVYDPAKHDALALTAEAIALLPQTHRWGVTFTTYHTDPVGDAECGWRWVVLGTPMASKVIAQAPADRLINLTQPLPPPRDSRYVRIAQLGHDPQPAGKAESPIAPTTPEPAKPEAPEAEAPSKTHHPVPKAAAPAAFATPAPAAPHSTTPPPNTSRQAPTPPRQRRRLVAAAIALPLLALGGAALWRSAPAANDAPTASDPHDSAAHIQALQNQLARSQQQNQQLARQLQTAQSRRQKTKNALTTKTSAAIMDATTTITVSPGYAPTTPVALVTPSQSGITPTDPVAAAPQPHAADQTLAIEASEPPAVAEPPSRRFVTLEPPRLEASASASLGQLARLIATEQVLWHATPGHAATRLTAAPPTLLNSPTLRLVNHPGGVRAELTRVNSLGIAQQHILGEARLEPRGLVWQWRSEGFGPADPNQPRGRALAQLHNLVRYAVFELRNDHDQLVAEVQPALPARLVTSSAGSPLALPASAAGLRLRINLGQAPVGWSLRHAENPTKPDTLVGPEGATLELMLRESSDTLTARWSPDSDPADARRRLARAQQDHDRFTQLLEEHHTLQQAIDQAHDKLPRDPDGQIDLRRRDQPRFADDFQKYENHRGAMDRFLAEHGLAPSDFQPMRDQRRDVATQIARDLAVQQHVSAFEGAVIHLTTPGSAAEFAVIQITGNPSKTLTPLGAEQDTP